MSDTVYAIASGKGGVGKTTTAINLGAMLADRNHSVVVVDTDLGMANLADFLDFEIETPTLHEVLAGDAESDGAIYDAPGDIDVLPSATDIEAFVKSDPANLQTVVADLREEYDYVLLDTGAGVSYDTLVPLALADGVLLVATPDVASVRDTAKTGELAERVETEVTGAVLTQRSSDILNADDVEATLGTDVLAVIPQDEAVPMGIDAGRPLAAFAPSAPAAQAYRSLAAVLTGEADPDPALESVAERETDTGDGPEAKPKSRSPRGESDDASSRSSVAEESGFEMPVDETAEAESTDAEPASNDPASTEPASTGPASNEPASTEPASAGSGDDPLSADAAQNVRDAIGDQSGGDIDSLLAGRQADERPDSAEDVPDADEGTASESATESDTTDSGGRGGARSVDDLINEHISDDRLSGESGGDGDDPLAEMGGDGFSDESADSDDESDPLRTEDPFADERDGTDSDDASANAESDEGETENDANTALAQSDTASDEAEAGEWDGDTESETDEAGVPFENHGRSSSSDYTEDRTADSPTDSATDPSTDSATADASTGSTPNEDFPTDEPGENGDSADSGLDADSSEDEESDEDGGVLGRLGSIFK